MNGTKLRAGLLRTIVYIAAAITIGVLVLLVSYVLIKGVPNLNWDMFSLNHTSENNSLMPALLNTVIITLLSLVIAVPFGVGAAVYLVEYAPKGNKFVSAVRMTAETLSGIPSIVFGLFGYILFAMTLGWGYSLLAGALTLSIMVLPVIMRATEEALKAVPDTFREGSFGLGAGRVRTVFKIVLPAAVPGIMAGVVLSVGRIVGETAALIYTAGTVADVPGSVMDSGRTLSVHMYTLWSEGLSSDASYATAVVLLILVVGLNALSAFIAKRIGAKNG